MSEMQSISEHARQAKLADTSLCRRHSNSSYKKSNRFVMRLADNANPDSQALLGFASPRSHISLRSMRLAGIEPASQPWQGRILPLNHRRETIGRAHVVSPTTVGSTTGANDVRSTRRIFKCIAVVSDNHCLSFETHLRKIIKHCLISWSDEKNPARNAVACSRHRLPTKSS